MSSEVLSMPFFNHNFFKGRKEEVQHEFEKNRSLLGLERLVLEDGEHEFLLANVVSAWKGLVRSQKASALAISFSDDFTVCSLIVLTIRDKSDPRNVMRVLGVLSGMEGGFIDRDGAHMLSEYVLGQTTSGVFAYAYVGSDAWPSPIIGDALLFLQGFGAARVDSLQMLKFAAKGGLLALTDERYWNRHVLGQGRQLLHCRHSGISNIRLELEEMNAKSNHVVDVDEFDDIDTSGVVNTLDYRQTQKFRHGLGPRLKA
jgi:hypothetical protein